MPNSVTYSNAYKRSLPNYENVTPFFSITREVPSNQNEDVVLAEIIEKVERLLTDKINEIDTDVAASKR